MKIQQQASNTECNYDVIQLRDIELKDEFLQNIQQNQNLKKLFLINCKINDLSKLQLNQLLHLTYINLSNNKITGFENLNIKNMKQLKFLILDCNKFKMNSEALLHFQSQDLLNFKLLSLQNNENINILKVFENLFTVYMQYKNSEFALYFEQNKFNNNVFSQPYQSNQLKQKSNQLKLKIIDIVCAKQHFIDIYVCVKLFHINKEKQTIDQLFQENIQLKQHNRIDFSHQQFRDNDLLAITIQNYCNVKYLNSFKLVNEMFIQVDFNEELNMIQDTIIARNNAIIFLNNEQNDTSDPCLNIEYLE